jgi:hypothetical protein
MEAREMGHEVVLRSCVGQGESEQQESEEEEEKGI